MSPTMSPTVSFLGGILLCSGVALRAQENAERHDDPRAADEILREFDSVRYPGFRFDLTMEEMERRVGEASQRQIDLSGEFWRDHPGHEELGRVLRTRWTLLQNCKDAAEQALEETLPIADDATGAPAVRRAAMLCRASAALRVEGGSVLERRHWIEAAEELAADDGETVAYLWTDFALRWLSEPEEQRRAFAHVVKSWPRAEATRIAAKAYRLVKKCGEIVPALETQEFPSERPFSLAAAAGTRRVALVFANPEWFSSDAPDVFGDLVQHREELSSRGLEVLGVLSPDETVEPLLRSLDQSLAIPWTVVVDPEAEETVELGAGLEPQVHRMHGGWSRALGVARTPCFLLLDEENRLLRVSERLETLLSESG